LLFLLTDISQATRHSRNKSNVEIDAEPPPEFARNFHRDGPCPVTSSPQNCRRKNVVENVAAGQFQFVLKGQGFRDCETIAFALDFGWRSGSPLRYIHSLDTALAAEGTSLSN
jgi:hypothetical protein